MYWRATTAQGWRERVHIAARELRTRLLERAETRFHTMELLFGVTAVYREHDLLPGVMVMARYPGLNAYADWSTP